MNPERTVGILGATSLVGGPLVERLADMGWRVHAFSRSPAAGSTTASRASWHEPAARDIEPIPRWIALCPLWALPERIEWIAALGGRRLVALSSTSLFTKPASPDAGEREVAARLAAAEEELARGAAWHGIELCLLRPTMIYDGVRDGNVAAIARFIRRFGFFPLAGRANGLRQPVHAADVAAACAAAVETQGLAAAYTLSGGEALPFRELVRRIFAWLDLPPRMPSLPRSLFAAALLPAHAVGLCRGLSTGMAVRMNQDLAFRHDDAARDLGFRPRDFAPGGDAWRHDATAADRTRMKSLR
jgi:nucleoside-diphosphate-sugar epimerase